MPSTEGVSPERKSMASPSSVNENVLTSTFIPKPPLGTVEKLPPATKLALYEIGLLPLPPKKPGMVFVPLGFAVAS